MGLLIRGGTTPGHKILHSLGPGAETRQLGVAAEGCHGECTFPAAFFIRGRESLDYIEEPDIFHETYGHPPLLTDTRFARFSQIIVETGLRCTKADYSWLIRRYWSTVKFGLIRESNRNKALGSGLASSPGELSHSVHEPAVVHKPFDVIDILRTPYRIDINQPISFVLDNVDQLMDASQRGLLAEIETARSLGLHAPRYPEKSKKDETNG